MNRNTGVNMGDGTVLKLFNWNYVFIILALQIIGLINLYSAAYSTEHLNRVFQSQAYWVFMGWLVFYMTCRLQYRFFLNHSALFYGFNLTALILVLIIGKRIYGSRRWLDLVFFQLSTLRNNEIFSYFIYGQLSGPSKT